MIVELQSRIREYATWVERGQEPVSLEEIMRRSDDTILLAGPVASTRPALRGPWPALVAAAIVLVIFGVFMWVFPTDEPVPPADSSPPPEQTGQAYYTTNSVPDGFVLQDWRSIGGPSLWFLREFEEEWLPTDGGFAVHGVWGHPFGVPADPDGYLDATKDAVPGAIELEVDARRAIVFDSDFSQGDVDTSVTWILAVDGEGGLFEVVTVGMSRDEALTIAAGVERVPVNEFNGLGRQLSWDVKVGTGQDDFTHSPPDRMRDLANEVRWALGIDLLDSRLAGAGQEGSVVTTHEGEIVETLGEAIESTVALHYLEVGEGGVDEALGAYPAAEVSPAQLEAIFDRLLSDLGIEVVLSQDPYVIQAGEGAVPLFDVGSLGREIPLEPVPSFDLLPETSGMGSLGEAVIGTEDRPVVVLGSVDRSELELAPIYLMLWFTETGDLCEGWSDGEGTASSCGFIPLVHLGGTGESSVQGDDGFVYGEVTYSVPLETAVVQALTGSETFWQRPIGGYGVFPYGGSVPKATTIVAFDDEGNEIGRWPA